MLHSFKGGSDEFYPVAGVVLDGVGNLYGTTYYGGLGDVGVVYKIDNTGQETVLYSFTGLSDGAHPSGMIRDRAGNLYGTTYYGGKYDEGVVFKVTLTPETEGGSLVNGSSLGNSEDVRQWTQAAVPAIDAPPL